MNGVTQLPAAPIPDPGLNVMEDQLDPASSDLERAPRCVDGRRILEVLRIELFDAAPMSR